MRPTLDKLKRGELKILDRLYPEDLPLVAVGAVEVELPVKTVRVILSMIKKAHDAASVWPMLHQTVGRERARIVLDYASKEPAK